jgi:hypothetical protein
MAKKKAKRSATQQWTAEKAGHILDEIEALGVTDSAFARQHGLNYGRIAWWRQRLDRLQGVRGPNRQKPLLSASKEVAGFVELKALPEATAETRIEVLLRNGRAVLIPMGVATDKLALLLDTIEGRAC